MLWSIYGGLWKTCHYVTHEHSSCHECSFVCVLRVPDFQVELQLDSHKHKQKGAVKRALFLDSQQPLLQRSVIVRHGERICNHTKIYLRVCPFSHKKISDCRYSSCDLSQCNIIITRINFNKRSFSKKTYESVAVVILRL